MPVAGPVWTAEVTVFRLAYLNGPSVSAGSMTNQKNSLQKTGLQLFHLEHFSFCVCGVPGQHAMVYCRRTRCSDGLLDSMVPRSGLTWQQSSNQKRANRWHIYTFLTSPSLIQPDASLLNTAAIMQCRRRWKNFQDAELKKTGVWTPAVSLKCQTHQLSSWYHYCRMLSYQRH